jgi:hypothetical protein
VCADHAMRHSTNPQVAFAMEVSGYLVGSAAFKAVGTSEPRLAGSIPVRLRQFLLANLRVQLQVVRPYWRCFQPVQDLHERSNLLLPRQ